MADARVLTENPQQQEVTMTLGETPYRPFYDALYIDVRELESCLHRMGLCSMKRIGACFATVRPAVCYWPLQPVSPADARGHRQSWIAGTANVNAGPARCVPLMMK